MYRSYEKGLVGETGDDKLDNMDEWELLEVLLCVK